MGMSERRWVLDATMGWPPCFCPVEGDLGGDFTIITGMNFLGSIPDGRVEAVVHEGGQECVEEFCKAYKTELLEWFPHWADTP